MTKIKTLNLAERNCSVAQGQGNVDPNCTTWTDEELDKLLRGLELGEEELEAEWRRQELALLTESGS